MRRPVLFASLVVLGTALAPVAATADATYHSAHIRLSPAAGTPGGSGFVENIHADGPNVYAHEQYHLQHAAPGTSYTVMLHIYLDGPSCAGAPADLTSAVLTTNAAGNASGNHVFTPADAAVLPKGVPLGVVWTMSAGPGMSYASSCRTIVLD